ncbi:MarR family winged helix-turn-helix transcriptional regulator [Microbacterium tenebrionis]|uniref:MarR family winged helix-turn-helix transcriptional regulator n=1 Tax=Microbacterium tenebrionis TaxID=2830665 RepID=UPI001588A67E|nr:MarR family transcriptional regulator [Microbacterium ihumii]
MQYFSRDSDLAHRSDLTAQEIEQCYRVLEALREWQVASRALAEASKRYMKLNESDMRAIRMIIRATESGEIVTPKDVAHEVGISSASTTKLVDRLVAGGHLVRVPHPHDRRTTCLEVTESTRLSAHETIGRQHARRFSAAASLSADDREAVIRFLEALTDADTPQGELASS